MKSTLLFLRVAILSISIGIILGAFGAHALKDVFGNYELDIWNKGIFYQITNSLGIILIVLLVESKLLKKSKLAMSLLTIGIIFFSGSLYTIALSKVFLEPNHWINIITIPITPIGGSLIIAGWILTFFNINNNRKK